MKLQGDARGLWRRAIRIVAVLVTIGTIAGMAGLAFGWVRHNQAVTLPQPAGPYAVGRVMYDWVDESRPEIFTPDPNDRRGIPVWVWYPVARDAGTAPPAPYLPAAWQQALQRSRGGLGGFVSQNPAAVHAHSEEDRPLAPDQGRFPLILLQPGLGPSHPDYTSLAEDLASRGYIVVASSPAYSSNAVAFADGRVVERSDAATVPDNISPEESKVRLDRLVDIWAADQVFLLNRLEQLDARDPDGRFTGRLDLNAIGVMGHSFGGAAAAETCHLDARCKAGVDLDGSPYGSVIEAGLRQPFLFMWSEPGPLHPETDEQSGADVASLRSHSSGKIFELTIRGARHFNFADYAVLYEPLLKPMQMLGSIDGRRGLAIASTYVAAFFDQYLKGRSQPLLDGPSPNYPEVQFGK